MRFPQENGSPADKLDRQVSSQPHTINNINGILNPGCKLYRRFRGILLRRGIVTFNQSNLPQAQWPRCLPEQNRNICHRRTCDKRGKPAMAWRADDFAPVSR